MHSNKDVHSLNSSYQGQRLPLGEYTEMKMTAESKL
jgi:hypothetical protein